MHGWLERAALGVVVTPLSDLTLTKAWGRDAAAGFAAYPQSLDRPRVSELSDATRFAVSGLDRISGYRSAGGCSLDPGRPARSGSRGCIPARSLCRHAAPTGRAGAHQARRSVLQLRPAAYLWPGEYVDAITSSAPLSRSAVEAIVLNPQLIGNPAGVPPTTGWQRSLARCQASDMTGCRGQKEYSFDNLVVYALSAAADSAAYPIYVYAAHSDGQTVSFVETQVTCPASVRKP